MEVSFCVQVSYLSPLVTLHVIDLAFIHRLIWQGRPNGKYLRLGPVNEHTCQSVRSPLKQHIPLLDQSLLNELITVLSRLTGLPSSSQEDAAFFVLDRHKVCGNLDIHDVGTVAVRSEVVHKQVMSVVHKEVESV